MARDNEIAGKENRTSDAVAEEWLRENAAAIEAYNREIDRRGIAIPPFWTGKDPLQLEQVITFEAAIEAGRASKVARRSPRQIIDCIKERGRRL